MGDLSTWTICLALSPQEKPSGSCGCSCGLSAKQIVHVPKIARATAPWCIRLVFLLLLYCIDRRIYLNLSESTHSAIELNNLKPAANAR